MNQNKQPIPTYIIPTLVIIAFVIIAASFYVISVLDPGPKPGSETSLLHFGKKNVGGKFVLKDINNHDVTEKDLKGKITLMYFGFTFCPDICPTLLQVISNALLEIPKDKLHGVQVMFITVDPDRDNISQLKTYLSNFHPSIIGLTGTKEQIDKMAKLYKVYYNKIEPKDEKDADSYQVDHSSIIYMIDKNGEYLEHFSTKATSQEISEEIIKLLD